MTPICEFIDLKAQYARIKDQVDGRMAAVLQHGRFIMGPEIAELETRLQDYTGSAHCITVASGTEALLIALMALGIWLHVTEHHEHQHIHERTMHAHPHVHDEHHQHAHGPEDPPGEPHTHSHEHQPLKHAHPHTPDMHHLHRH